MPLIVSGRAVNLLAKPIENVQVGRRFQFGDGHDARARRAAGRAGHARRRFARTPRNRRKFGGVNRANARRDDLANRLRRRTRAAAAIVWHAIALLLAALVAWLIFAAYRQPDLMLDLAGMRLCCGTSPAMRR